MHLFFANAMEWTFQKGKLYLKNQEWYKDKKNYPHLVYHFKMSTIFAHSDRTMCLLPRVTLSDRQVIFSYSFQIARNLAKITLQ